MKTRGVEIVSLTDGDNLAKVLLAIGKKPITSDKMRATNIRLTGEVIDYMARRLILNCQIGPPDSYIGAIP